MSPFECSGGVAQHCSSAASASSYFILAAERREWRTNWNSIALPCTNKLMNDNGRLIEGIGAIYSVDCGAANGVLWVVMVTGTERLLRLLTWAGVGSAFTQAPHNQCHHLVTFAFMNIYESTVCKLVHQRAVGKVSTDFMCLHFKYLWWFYSLTYNSSAQWALHRDWQVYCKRSPHCFFQIQLETFSLDSLPRTPWLDKTSALCILDVALCVGYQLMSQTLLAYICLFDT